MTRRWFGKLLILAIIVITGCVGPLDPEVEYGKLCGTWHLVSSERKGRKAPAIYTHNPMIFDSSNLFFHTPEHLGNSWVYIIDPSQTPKHFDLIQELTHTKNGTTVKLGRLLLKGIYCIRGERLEICWANQPDEPRPTEFTTRRAQDLTMVVYERATQEADTVEFQIP